MFDFLQKGTEINTTQIVDEIEAAVYVHVRPYGFKKYGRTLHRFVSEDISQVIHSQSGMPAHGMGGLLCVNVGIRIPECSDRVFQPKTEKKKYYHDYDCTIRSRLGTVSGKQGMMLKNLPCFCDMFQFLPNCKKVVAKRTLRCCIWYEVEIWGQ